MEHINSSIEEIKSHRASTNNVLFYYFSHMTSALRESDMKLNIKAEIFM